MKHSHTLAVACLCVLTACRGGASTTTSPEHGNGLPGDPSACGEDGAGLSGASWSLARSRFAFGGTPTEGNGPGGQRFEGPEGVVAVSALGSALGIPNSGASAGARPDFSADATAMEAHVKDYFRGFGIPTCQMGGSGVSASQGGGGPVGGPVTASAGHLTISLPRTVDGIPVADSQAYASINDADQSTREMLFWPAIDAAVVTEAKRLRDELADPTKLAAFKAKLPEAARGDGKVAIHHSIGIGGTTTVRAGVTWDTQQERSSISFDAQGNALVGSAFDDY